MTRSTTLRCIGFGVLLAAAAPSFAQSTINPSNKWGWNENIGWTDWYIAGFPVGNDGAAFVPLASPVIMKGYVWNENIGWIHLGDGTPTAGPGARYSNTTSTDYGVNFDPLVGTTYDLAGFGWSENVGWIDFGAAKIAHAPSRARYSLETSANRLRGWVWNENIGWIDLNHDSYFVEALCIADFDGNGIVNSTDVSTFINAWFADLANGTLITDVDGNGIVNSTDVSTFINLWFADLVACG